MHKFNLIIAISAALASPGFAAAQLVGVEADILSPGDAGYDGSIPANLLVIDVFVDIAITDAWTAGGLIARTRNGAALQYFDADLNTPGLQPGLFNPGRENQFMTFLSRPRGRDANNRFTNGGAVAAGTYDTPGASPITSPTEINVGYFASPPTSYGSPSVDGYIARFALDVSATGHDVSDFTIALSEPATPIYFACAPEQVPIGGFDIATFDFPSPFQFDFWVTVPEPASIGSWAIAICALGRSRQSTSLTEKTR